MIYDTVKPNRFGSLTMYLVSRHILSEFIVLEGVICDKLLRLIRNRKSRGNITVTPKQFKFAL